MMTHYVLRSVADGVERVRIGAVSDDGFVLVECDPHDDHGGDGVTRQCNVHLM